MGCTIESEDLDRGPGPIKNTGFAFKNLRVHGISKQNPQQPDFLSKLKSAATKTAKSFRREHDQITILEDFDGLVEEGQSLLVLGRPGSGCSTLLKAIGGSTRGLKIDQESVLNYQGIPASKMHGVLRANCIYTAESDVHFPELTVEETLLIAAEAQTPRSLTTRRSRSLFAQSLTNKMIASFNLSSCASTNVGNSVMRGLSGGEQKRVTLAEAYMGGAAIQCWDHSTRGMDSSTALQFICNLTTRVREIRSAAAVTIYQCSQAMYENFDYVTLLHSGKQIYYGSVRNAEAYFVDMGFKRASVNMSTADFLTALTNPPEASLLVRPGFEEVVPRCTNDFVERWKSSLEKAELHGKILTYGQKNPLGGASGLQHMAFLHELRNGHRVNRSLHQSPYTLSFHAQLGLCLRRGMTRLRNKIEVPISNVIANGVLALIVGSIFYNLDDTTASFYGRGVLIFFATMLNGFMSGFEVLTIWAQRPIVEKHSRLGFYQPSAEAVSAMICDLPNKVLSSILFNVTLYFMANLRRTPEAFFTFLLFSFFCLLTMSMFFRSIGSLCRTYTQTFVPVGVIMFMCIIYTGFVIPPKYMQPWFGWFRYINPLAYAFESLMINEFANRDFVCAILVPAGPGYDETSTSLKTCAAAGAVAGKATVDGDTYLRVTYGYIVDHQWRNLGILCAMMLSMCTFHIMAAQYILAAKPKGEILAYLPSRLARHQHNDEERVSNRIQADRDPRRTALQGLEKQSRIVHWENIAYEVPQKRTSRQILHGIDGWAKPGTLTALMGATGAGKTTLLDVLARRTKTGATSGGIYIDGAPIGTDFPRKIGYSQQSDIHLSTATVREALIFSARLRQPKSISDAEKLRYVDEVLHVLGLMGCAEAVIGNLGEGLNVEQRRRLTIAVEIVAKPEVLLFLDEPTSGLDSQTAWSICSLLRKLANSGQTIVCTIHQPTAALLEMFDQLLLIDAGETVYFGPIGEQCKSMIRYFEDHGAPPHQKDDNPSEWMFRVTSRDSARTWPETWESSDERYCMQEELSNLREQKLDREIEPSRFSSEYASSFWTQFKALTYRTMTDCWRTPAYLWGKLAFYFLVSLIIGFSFWNTPNSLQGLQNQLFSVFLVITTFSCAMQQVVPDFIRRRDLFETRERPSRIYSWQAFLISTTITEILWQTVIAILVFPVWYYPTGMYRNSFGYERHERGLLMFLLTWSFFVFTSTLSYLVASAIEIEETAVNIAQLLFYLVLLFCGVLASPSAMPRFWIFMYRISPLTYQISSMFSVAVAGTEIQCADSELLRVPAYSGMDCRAYLQSYIDMAGGRLVNPHSLDTCLLCPLRETDEFLATLGIHYKNRWWQFAIQLGYIACNVVGMAGLYWITRVWGRNKNFQGRKK